jgi:hypothetical protein
LPKGFVEGSKGCGTYLPDKQVAEWRNLTKQLTLTSMVDAHCEGFLRSLLLGYRLESHGRKDGRELVPELSARELACYVTDKYSYYISESSVYRILKANGLISVPSFRIMSASDKFHDQTTAINQMWQTDFTYFKIVGWGWHYLSTILDDYSRYIVMWNLCSTMRAEDVADTYPRWQLPIA